MKKYFVLAVFISTLLAGASFVLASPAVSARQDQAARGDVREDDLDGAWKVKASGGREPPESFRFALHLRGF